MNTITLSGLSEDDQHAWQRLIDLLSDKPNALVAFSGGVDSALLAFALHQAVGDQMRAVMVDSAVHTEADRQAARQVAKQAGLPFEIIQFDDLKSEKFCSNPSDRCYFCKYNRFEFLLAYANKNGYTSVMEGSNLDDAADYRPGMRAVKELGVLSPLEQCHITKEQIRRFAKAFDLPVWNRPSAPCLATRFTFGTTVTINGLEMIRQAEAYLDRLGFTSVRLRYDGRSARIEVDLLQLEQILAKREEIVKYFRQLGFVNISLDLEGYRMGSNNEGWVK
ncbi:MAG: ATP-dependent sacrificial sulfur transferase LarE [Anaerolineaceae bacterium]|nr:ATP-dependent sacrificial sulfur transferase LarE [Anaerolineaceae bacterium]